MIMLIIFGVYIRLPLSRGTTTYTHQNLVKPYITWAVETRMRLHAADAGIAVPFAGGDLGFRS